MPSDPEKGTLLDLVDDIVALLDVLGIAKVFVVGTDFGAIAASMLTVLHPERVSAMVTFGLPFMLPGPNAVQLDKMPQGFYMTRWKEPGRAEADFGRLDVKTAVKNIYILFSGTELPSARNEQEEIMDLVDPSTPLPPWFSEEDLAVYASLYEKTGFRFALQVPYRSLQVNQGIEDPKVKVPAFLIIGEKDCAITFPGIEDYVRSGKVKHFVPELETVFIEEGNHFIHEQLPEKVNELLINFFNKHDV